jgi:chitinase
LLDIDWEYPGYEDHSGTPNDGESWNLLLNDLRAALDELEEETGYYYGLTAYVSCDASTFHSSKSYSSHIHVL